MLQQGYRHDRGQQGQQNKSFSSTSKWGSIRKIGSLYYYGLSGTGISHIDNDIAQCDIKNVFFCSAEPQLFATQQIAT